MRIILEAVILAVVGIIIGIGGALAGARLMEGQLSGFGDLAGAIMGFIFGYTAGVVIGLILIRRIFHSRGSIILGLMGSILGAFLTIGLAEPLNLNLNPNLLFGTFFLAVPLLAVIGFHLKHK